MDAIVSNRRSAGRDRRRPARRGRPAAGEGLRRHAARLRRRDPRRARAPARRTSRSTSGTVRRRARSSRSSGCIGRRHLQGAARRAPAMIVNQWVPAAHKGDAIGDSARRVRDLLRAHGPRVRALRADDRRRAAAATCGRSPIRRRDAGDLTIFHYALPSPMTEAFAALPHGPRAAVPQRHAGRVTSRRTIRRCSAWPSLGRERARDARRPRRSGARRLGVQPAGARGARLRADRRLPDRRRHVARSRSRVRRPALDRHPRRRARELPVRRPDRAEQEDRGPHPAGRALQALRRRLLPLHLRRPVRRRCRGTIR